MSIVISDTRNQYLISIKQYDFIGKESIVFVSIPRFQDGVPATLGYISDKFSSEGNPLIAPYPSWEWNTLGPEKCDGITSVYRVQVREFYISMILSNHYMPERKFKSSSCPLGCFFLP